MRSQLVTVFLVPVATAISLLAADDLFNGIWKLNAARSTYSLPRAVPPSATLKYDATADQLTSTTEEIDADGKPYTNRYTTRYDGKDVAIVAGLLGANDRAQAHRRLHDRSNVEAKWQDHRYIHESALERRPHPDDYHARNECEWRAGEKRRSVRQQ